MRRLILQGFALFALMTLVSAPISGAEPGVYKTPFIPADVLQGPPVDGTVSLTVQVWTGTRWATEAMMIVPAKAVLPTECSLPMMEDPKT